MPGSPRCRAFTLEIETKQCPFERSDESCAGKQKQDFLASPRNDKVACSKPCPLTRRFRRFLPGDLLQPFGKPPGVRLLGFGQRLEPFRELGQSLVACRARETR